MAFISFQCYACGKGLKVPEDKAGRKAKCNQCGTVLTIPAQSSYVPGAPGAVPSPVPDAQLPPPPQSPAYPTAVDQSTQVQPGVTAQEQVYEPAFADIVPQAPAGNIPPGGSYPLPGAFGQMAPEEDVYVAEEFTEVSRHPTWEMTRLGLLLVFIGACVMAGAYSLHVIGYLLISISMAQGLTGSIGFNPGDAPRILLALSTVIYLGSLITAVVGYIFCMLGPQKKGSFGLLIAVNSVAGVELLLILIFHLPALFNSSFFLEFSSGRGWFYVIWFLFLLIQLLFGAQVILFCLVIRAFALGLKKKLQAAAAMVPLYLASGYIGIRLLGFISLLLTTGVSSITAERVMGWINLTLLWLGIFAFIAFIIVYTMNLWKTRKLIPLR